MLVESADDLRSLLASAFTDVSVFVPPRAHFKLGGAELACGSEVAIESDEVPSFRVSIRSTADGATLDGERRSRLFRLSSRCMLSLQHLSLINGFAEADKGGAIYSTGGREVRLSEVRVADCSADNGGAIAAYSGSRTEIWCPLPTLALPSSYLLVAISLDAG